MTYYKKDGLSKFLHLPTTQRCIDNFATSYEARDVYVRFASNRRDTASGFSCRIVGILDEHEQTDPTTEASTSSPEVSSTLGPGQCPLPDESKCDCGRIKDIGRPFPPGPWHWRVFDDNKIVGGQEAQAHAYPWQVALTYYDFQVQIIEILYHIFLKI